MSERGCIKCGYILAGLPAVGTVVTCPECSHENNLAVSPQVRENVFTPLAWATLPMAPCALYIATEILLGIKFGYVAGFLLALGFIGGATTAVVLVHKAIGRQLETGHAPMRRGDRPALAMTFGLVSVVINAVAIAAVYVAVALIKSP